MKIHAVLTNVFAISTLGSALQAQTCTTPVHSWQGSYSLNATATGVACGSGSTCDINETAVATTRSISLQVSSCSAFALNFVDQFQTIKADDTASTPCPTGGTTNFAGDTGGPANATGLSIDVSPGQFMFVPGPSVAGTETITACGENPFPEPTWEGISPILSYPLWPPVLTLPAQVEPLRFSQSFSADALFFGAPSTWTESFTLNPNYKDDDDCRQEGNSSIGCQTQSLGEDVLIVGTGFKLHYESGRNASAGGDSIASADAAMIGGWTLSVHHAYDPNTNTLFLGDGTQRNGYQLGSPVSFNRNLLLTSADSSEVYVFSAAGQHLQTLRPLTGALVYNFGYDGPGELVSVTDASGNVTTIQRDSSEQPTAIISAYGQTDTLTLDNNGFLSKITDPLGNSETLVNTSTGLLTSRTDQNGNTFTYTYDANNRLAKEADPVGGYTALTRTDATSGLGWTVGETTSMGRQSSYQSTLDLPWVQTGTSTQSEQHINVWPNGLHATSSMTQQGSTISKSVALPDGTSSTDTLGPDPVWGLQVPVVTSETLTEGTLTMTSSQSRSATLGTSGSPFSVSTATDTQTINGRTYSSVFSDSTRTWLNTSPVGRTVTIGLDALERVASTQVEGLTASNLAYDSRGRLSTVTQGPRVTTFAYDIYGRLASVTDPLGLQTSLTYDADGRPLTTTLADGRIIKYTHDANGNLTSITPPGKPAFSFFYTPTNLISVAGQGAVTSTRYSYDTDRELTTVTRPDGKKIDFAYDTAGRLSSLITPTETVDYAYSPTSGNLETASITGGEGIAYGYNGPLATSTQWTGIIAGTVGRTFNNNFWVNSQGINSANSIAFMYDNDGLLAAAGALTVTRNSENSLITGTTLGSATDSRTYNSFGELTGYTASYNGSVLDNVTYTRDADGRISGKTETIGGQTNTYVYNYDLTGRLTGVTQNGQTVSAYSYDTNSNRLTATTPSGTASATYDAQDRLLTYGTAAYTYTANGELQTQTVGSQKTTYQYDVLGNLIAVTLPNGTAITYIVDAENHRIGKEVNGALTEGFLYDGNKIVAQLNASNAIVSQFVFASRRDAPDYMISGGVTYRIFSDQLGSPRLIVNTSTGAIAEGITYDEFGNVLSDTKPGFQPFGFAGGLYDQDTKLIRFGARDYNPAVGRWTAKDRILFAGGDTNLYGYARTDPVSRRDPSGLVPQIIRDLFDWSTYTNGWSSIFNRNRDACSCKDNNAEDEGNGMSGPEMVQKTVEHLAPEVGGSALEIYGERLAEEGIESGEGIAAVGKVVGPTATIVEGSQVLAEGIMVEKKYFDRLDQRMKEIDYGCTH